MTTRAPAPANALAIASPIPFEPPVTTTRAPVKSKRAAFTGSRIARAPWCGQTASRVGARAHGGLRSRAMTTELRLGIIGCGAIADWHWNALHVAAPRVRVTACIDPVAERA